MGFDAIWISPVVMNSNDGYHGYWATDFYETNDHFGTSEDLLSLVRICHMRGILVMVDVVANHAGYLDEMDKGFEGIKPFNKEEYYHEDCEITDWSNRWQMENCRLAGLPDLDQNHDFVRSKLKEWVKWLVYTYEFDGIRIDTLGHVSKEFWGEF